MSSPVLFILEFPPGYLKHQTEIYKQQLPCGAKMCSDTCPRTLSVPRSEQFSESFFELRGTDNVQGQISEHIFAPNGDYCLHIPSNLFCNARSFENWGIFSDIPQFQLGNIRSSDMFKPIARERKYLMDYVSPNQWTNANPAF